MPKPSINRRVGFRWAFMDHQYMEPTSTLVLTSPGAAFVDIRIKLPTEENEPYLPNIGGPMERLDWAFAGHSQESRLTPEHALLAVRHATWEHWVDSRVPVGQPTPVDQADLIEQPDGSTIEHGRRMRPETCVITSYEEVWVNDEPEYTGLDAARYCVVLQLDAPQLKARGMIVRVGHCCQGILRVGGNTTIERWQYGRPPKEPHGKEVDVGAAASPDSWRRTVRIGDCFVPCAFTFSAVQRRVGDMIKYFGHTWVVSERVEWGSA